ETFLKSGDFVWNAGIFVWSIPSIIKAFQELKPDIAELFESGGSDYFTDREDAFIEKAYSHCKSISIDYAIMEKAENVFMVLGDFGWSDLGSWDALHEIKQKDEHGNVIEGNVILYDSQKNFIKGNKEKLLVINDLEGYLVADFEDVLLICKKDDASKFKSFVNEVKASKGEKYV
ncbi:MAG: mannose-1-phosphate guanylyltransferase, partial [Cyclobacteriaceae bacterium]|nr:mannose-1-phosphate guanylyltransferase [Cyclobacteriaceae bacterium HetDA_MAG_MS6]